MLKNTHYLVDEPLATEDILSDRGIVEMFLEDAQIEADNVSDPITTDEGEPKEKKKTL
nr:11164_t:CDS:2 [Entrophospora candida]